jgi:WD40 repeat protein
MCFRKCNHSCGHNDKICEPCFNSYKPNNSLGSFIVVKCGHQDNKDIYLGTSNGRIIKLDNKNKQRKEGELKTNSTITSLIAMGGRIVVTNSNGEFKAMKNISFSGEKEIIMEKTFKGEQLQTLKLNENKVALMQQICNRKVELWSFGSQISNEKNTYTSKSKLFSMTKLNDEFLIFGRDDNTISMWKHTSGSEYSFNTDHSKGIYNIVKLKYGTMKDHVITIGGDKLLKLWNVNSDKAVKNVLSKEVDAYAGILFKIKELLDGRVLFCSNDQKVKLYDLHNSEICSTFSIGKTFDYLVINENIFMTLSEDSIIRTFDTRKNTSISEFKLDSDYAVRIMSPFNYF